MINGSAFISLKKFHVSLGQFGGLHDGIKDRLVLGNGVADAATLITSDDHYREGRHLTISRLVLHRPHLDQSNLGGQAIALHPPLLNVV